MYENSVTSQVLYDLLNNINSINFIFFIPRLRFTLLCFCPKIIPTVSQESCRVLERVDKHFNIFLSQIKAFTSDNRKTSFAFGIHLIFYVLCET